MNQTRVFLIFAWLMVATLLWMEWSKEKAAPPASATPVAAQPAIPSDDNTVPSAEQLEIPQAPASAATPAATDSATVQNERVTVTTDVLRLVVDGGNALQAELLHFPQSKQADSAPVKLFDQDPAHFYVAQSGWINAGGSAPSHKSGFMPENADRAIALSEGAESVSVPFIWHGPDGVSIRRTYTFVRGKYAVDVRDEIVNAGAQPWQGYVYRQLIRKPPNITRGMTNPDSFSFNGATWYSPQGGGYQRRAFTDFVEDGKLDQKATGGWIALLQHHFFSAWIPDAKDDLMLSLDATASGDLIRSVGPGVQVAPGQQATTSARLYVGPKLVEAIEAQNVPGLDRAVDYSRFSILALLGQGLFSVLSWLHGMLGNWGWSIIGLVILLKLVLYPLSATQYKSAAKMRKLQPRLVQLKERYGDDRQKYQTAMMDLYKKEKINPMAGCLPILPQMIIFMALYWVLVESVELRQAPWIGWIQDLTARDPYFILPVINMGVMFVTQKLTPTPGMDPMQARMMQLMPLVFGVMMAFMPAGLVLYWATNGALGLLQQWWMIKQHGEKPVTSTKKA